MLCSTNANCKPRLYVLPWYDNMPKHLQCTPFIHTLTTINVRDRFCPSTGRPFYMQVFVDIYHDPVICFCISKPFDEETSYLRHYHTLTTINVRDRFCPSTGRPFYMQVFVDIYHDPVICFCISKPFDEETSYLRHLFCVTVLITSVGHISHIY